MTRAECVEKLKEYVHSRREQYPELADGLLDMFEETDPYWEMAAFAALDYFFPYFLSPEELDKYMHDILEGRDDRARISTPWWGSLTHSERAWAVELAISEYILLEDKFLEQDCSGFSPECWEEICVRREVLQCIVAVLFSNGMPAFQEFQERLGLLHSGFTDLDKLAEGALREIPVEPERMDNVVLRLAGVLIVQDSDVPWWLRWAHVPEAEVEKQLKELGYSEDPE